MKCLVIGVVVLVSPLVVCTAPPDAGSAWAGSVDTLANGAVEVTNPAQGLWTDASRWTVDLTFVLGSIDDEGPELFGRIRSIAVDPLERVYVLDGDAQEIRVFDTEGSHVRTFGRRGEGPGELRRGMALVFDTVGTLWVLDPGNARISVFDTAGVYLDNYRMVGSYFTTRWNGGFAGGAFYNLEPFFAESGVRFALVRKGSDLESVGEARIPQYEGQYYTHISADGQDRNRTPVPFTPRLRWRFDPAGFLWFAITDQYQLFKRTLEGDTVGILASVLEPLPVRSFDRDTAVASLDWFRDLGGRIDRSVIPDQQPLISDFFVDHEGYVWVMPVTDGERQNRVMHVFDPSLRFLGELVLPVAIYADPNPVITRTALWAVSRDALGVESVMRFQIRGRT